MTMKAFIFEPHDQEAVERADRRAPTPSAMSERDRERPAMPGVEREADADAARSRRGCRPPWRASAATDSTDRSMWPAMMTQRQADRHDADEGRLLDDVGEDADLEVVRDGEREDRQHDEQHEPDEIVEDELEERAGVRGRSCRRTPSAGAGARLRARSGRSVVQAAHSTGFTGVGRRLQIAPERRVVDIVLGDRGARDLDVRAPGSRSVSVALAGRARRSSPGLISCLFDDLVGRTWRAPRPGRRAAARPRPCSQPLRIRSRPTGAPFERHHHDVARLLARGFERRRRRPPRGARRGLKIRSMSGLASSWSATMLPALRRPPTAWPAGEMIVTSGKRLHLLLEALLDVERVGVARVAEDLQHLALRRRRSSR